MRTFFCAAVACALAASWPFASALAQAEAKVGGQVPRGLAFGELRAVIESIDGLTVKEVIAQGDARAFVVSVEGLPFVFAPTCDPAGANCTSLAFIGAFPQQIKANPVDINAYNLESSLGWLATDTKSGLTVVRNSVILAGNTKAGLEINIKTYIGFYAIVAETIVKNGGGGTIGFEGVEISPRERVVDAAHQPSSTFGLEPEILELISDKQTEEGLRTLLSDAQTYARLRKIANDVYGR